MFSFKAILEWTSFVRTSLFEFNQDDVRRNVMTSFTSVP